MTSPRGVPFAPSRSGSPAGRSLVALLATAAVALGAALGASCSVNPATGERQLSLVGEEQEIEMGRQTVAQVRATMGIYDDEELQSLIQEIGTEMARDSERPDLPWSFQIVDEPTPNAFAAPGGFLYFTRGMLARFNSEAELAAVLGHEIGHVTARHSVEQISKQQVAQLGLGLGSVFVDEIAALSDVLGAGLGVLFLKFSRDDERQADRLGFRYLTEQGYDPREMADVFEMFRRMSEAQGGSGVPTWLSTHPTPTSRIEEIRQMVDSVPEGQLEGTRVERESYLQRLEGMVYGPDPRNGYFIEDRFVHPELAFQLEFPGGWERSNMARMVAAVSPEQDAQVQLALADASSPEEAAKSFLESEGVEAGDAERTEINGFEAVAAEFRAQGQENVLRGLAVFLRDGDRVYQLLGVTPQGRYQSRASALRDFVTSFERMEDDDVLDAEPLRVELVTVDEETTVSALADDRDSPLPAEELAQINGLQVDETVPSGHTLKWVTGELPDAMREDGEGPLGR